VVLVEQAGLNHAASGANAGTLHIQIPAFHFAAYQFAGPAASTEQAAFFRATNALFAAAGDAWRTLEQELGAELGVRLGGGLMVAATADQMGLLRAKSSYENEVGIETEVLSNRELLDRAPYLSPRLAGASWCAAEGFANPLLVAPAFMRQARGLGAREMTRRRVVAITRERRRSFQVETTMGMISARRVVAAAGAGTAAVAAMVGVSLPVRTFPLQVLATERWPPILDPLIQRAGPHLSLRQTPYGSFVIGGGWPGRGRTGVSAAALAGNLAVAREVLPALGRARLVRAWGALTTGAGRANRVGIAGAVERVPGFYVLVAGGWGFTLAPVLGRLLAETIVDGAASLPIAAFAPDARWVFADPVG
jgi:glycine/D-amino acid oxidase-like deaminating enzyme